MKTPLTVVGGLCDTHVNAYDPRFEYPAEVAVHEDPYLPDQLEPVFTSSGVARYIVSAVLRTPESRRLFLGLSRKGMFPKGLVPLINLRDPELRADLDSFESNKYVVAVRDMFDELRTGEIDTDEMRDALLLAGDCRRVINLLVRGNQIAELGELLHRLDPKRRGLTIALDHLGWPDVDQGLVEWENGIRNLARNPGVVVKCSYLFPQSHPNYEQVDRHRHFRLLSHVLATFGPGRMLFATDFPNSSVQANYPSIVHNFVAWMNSVQMGNGDRAAIFGSNAERVYGQLFSP